MAQLHGPELLVEPDWLEARLGDPKVRIFDCTLTRVPQPSGASLWESGRAAWEAAHIPGAGYLHMIDDLSDPDGPFPYALPPPEIVAELMSSFGVARDDTVVLYGAGPQSAVHRAWWVLVASGLRDVRVLDGGWERWREEGRPVESGMPEFPPAAFVGEARSGLVADSDDVGRALDDSDICLVHSLSEAQFCGTGGQVYGAPGRIPGSINIPASSLVDPDTWRFHPVDRLREIFSSAGVDRAVTVIPYCGGGIAASTVFFALALAGYGNVRLYDGSLLDWASDPARPMTTGPIEP